MNFASAFTPEKLQEAWNCLLNEFPFAIWETLYSWCGLKRWLRPGPTCGLLC